MTKSNLPKSLRKYIRLEKARIRREVSDFKEQQELIQKLYEKIFEQYRKKQANKEATPVMPQDKKPAQPVTASEEK